MAALLKGLHTAFPTHTSALTIQETQPSRCWQNRKSLEKTDGYAENSVESRVAVITVRTKASTHAPSPRPKDPQHSNPRAQVLQRMPTSQLEVLARPARSATHL